MKQSNGGYKLMKHTGKFAPHKGASLSANFEVQRVHKEGLKKSRKKEK